MLVQFTDFQIFVTDLNGKTMTLMVKNETSIDKLKDMVSDKKSNDCLFLLIKYF